jgi:hypothetical protein
MTGTSELLDKLSCYVPDDFINEHWPYGPTGGRRRAFSAAQLWRTHLLLVLTPAHAMKLPGDDARGGVTGGASRCPPGRVPDVRMLRNFILV